MPHLALTGMHRWTNRAGEISHRPDDMDGPGGTGAATARQFSSRTNGETPIHMNLTSDQLAGNLSMTSDQVAGILSPSSDQLAS